MQTNQTTQTATAPTTAAMQEYLIRKDALNSKVQQAVFCLRKNGFSASWLDGVLRTSATRSQIAMSCGMSINII